MLVEFMLAAAALFPSMRVTIQRRWGAFPAYPQYLLEVHASLDRRVPRLCAAPNQGPLQHEVACCSAAMLPHARIALTQPHHAAALTRDPHTQLVHTPVRRQAGSTHEQGLARMTHLPLSPWPPQELLRLTAFR